VFIDVYRGQYLEKLYQYWVITQAWDHCKVKYVFRDERFNPPDHQYSNYGMAMSALFPTGIPEGCAEIRMQGELNREEAVRNYEQKLTESMDILLLSVGTDGHMASLFSQNKALI
jgi:6-phosphogluconolactonase/glucosamine-6-phosphate isomerase/deaminase